MDVEKLLLKALEGYFLSKDEGLAVYTNAPLSWLVFAAQEMRFRKHPEKIVTWIIDRNINYSNICMSGCKFCNFYRSRNHPEAYVISIEEYKSKIDELFALGGDQLLLQGGMHPDITLSFYTSLFKELKSIYPRLKLHALGPPEIVHIAKRERLSYTEVLEKLIDAGLDSLPGAGAEILSDRVRKILSPKKCTSAEWLKVMECAHKLGITTSATMMFGHIESREERIEHLIQLRNLQSQKPAGHKGFVSFIPWPFQDQDTVLYKHYNRKNNVTAEEYIRTIAMSRIMLPNVDNIQASWLTVGKYTAQVCLHAGANDFGSIMIEEHVVSVAGASNTFNEAGIKNAITEAGFIPKRRDQQFNLIEDNVSV